MTERAALRRTTDFALLLEGLVLGLARKWLLWLNVIFALFAGLPVLAPALMAAGHAVPAKAIYTAYSVVCHQLPQRSYFLFGSQRALATYSLDEILQWGADPGNLRAFVGNAQMGYKMAYAHRLTAIHTSMLMAGLFFTLVRRRLKPLPWQWYLLLIAPMALDGLAHIVNDVTGLGFRDTNAWLAALTGGVFGSAFYQGDTLGSFNWLMRTVTGALFGLATVWLTYPLLELGMKGAREQRESKSLPGTSMSNAKLEEDWENGRGKER